MINLYAMECPRLVSVEQYHLLWDMCSTARREQVKKFVFQRDKEIAVFTECFARYCISKKFGLSFETMAFSRNCFGKPYITNTVDSFFNVSHSGDYVICGVSNKPIGVDVEEIGKAPLEVAEYYFNMDEKKILREKNGKEADKFFYALWTLKEAYLKMVGIGLQNLSQCSFSIDSENGKITCFIDGKIAEGLVFSLIEKEHYIMAVCGDRQVKLQEVIFKEFLKYLQQDVQRRKK